MLYKIQSNYFRNLKPVKQMIYDMYGKWLEKKKEGNNIVFAKKTNIPFLKPEVFKFPILNFLEFVFFGLNYHNKRVFHSRQLIFYIDIHRSHKFFLHEPLVKPYKTRIHKRRILLFTLDKLLADRFRKVIKSFRMPNVYTGKGIYLKDDIYNVKTGKVRKK
jgi:hypothetical protein